MEEKQGPLKEFFLPLGNVVLKAEVWPAQDPNGKHGYRISYSYGESVGDQTVIFGDSIGHGHLIGLCCLADAAIDWIGTFGFPNSAEKAEALH